jgi:hypothetical protein
VHDREQPSAQIGAGTVQVALVETADERVLHQVVGAVLVAEQSAGIATQTGNLALAKREHDRCRFRMIFANNPGWERSYVLTRLGVADRLVSYFDWRSKPAILRQLAMTGRENAMRPITRRPKPSD